MQSISLIQFFQKLYYQRYKFYRFFLLKKLPEIIIRIIKKCIEIPSANIIKYVLQKSIAYIVIRVKPLDANFSYLIKQFFNHKSCNYTKYLLGDRLLRSRVYSDVTGEYLRGAAVSNEINAVFRYADYITQINSYEEVKLELFEKLFFNHEFSTYLNNSQRIKAITILIKNNHLEIARNIYDQLTIKSEATLPVFLQHVVYINKWRGYKNCLNGSRLYIKILESRKYFEEHISNNRNSICIVGNGTLGLSNKSSDDIDSNDVIIRFNNYDVNQEKRCGKKQNVWVRIANGEIKSDFSSDNKFTIIASNNFENKRLNPLAYYPNLQNLNGSFTTIPSEIFRELISSLNCLPSTGLALLYWIYKINGEFPKEKIYGFSHFSKDNDFDTHYYTDIPERIIHYHNWQREADFFQRLIK